MKEFGKNLMIKKKGIPLDEKETFCNIIDLLEETIIRSEKIYDEVNIDMINYEENFYLIIDNLFHLHYGEWKAEIIHWYLWERKDYKTGEIGLLEWTNQDTDETKEVTIKCSEDLWDILKEIEQEK
jgi:hypothetical protein